MGRIKELSADALRKVCNPGVFKFKTTDELKVTEKILNQQRASHAIDFGLKMKGKGYNIFAVGVLGTGRNTAVSAAVEKIAAGQPTPDDWCYVYNFDSPDEPKAIRLKGGLGEEFRKDIEEVIKELKSSVPKAFESKDYEEQKRYIIKKFQDKRDELVDGLEAKSQEKGFELKQTSTGLISVPIVKGKPLSSDKFETLNSEEKVKIEASREELQAEIAEVLRKVRNLEKEIKAHIKKLDNHIALFATEHFFDELEDKYKEYPYIKEYLECLKEDVVENIDVFREKEMPPFPMPNFGMGDDQKLFTKYKVNVLINNKNTKGAPIIKENNPTYYNLIGRIEYRPQLGAMTTDFTMIKPGAIHRANGGYLIVQAMDILKNFMAWEAMKGIIKTEHIKIEDINEQFRVISTVTLKPQAIPVNLKIIMVGHPLIFHLLYMLDEEFSKLFKVKADFNTLLEKNDVQIENYANFISLRAKHDKLLPFTNEAVAKIIEYSSRLIEDQNKLSARLLDIADILREADHWAKDDSSQQIMGYHITKAVEEKVYRSDMIEERLREMIREGSILIDVKKEVVGQLNGLSVIDSGDYSFGLPSRITASIFMGQKGLIDIQREARLSGKIHSKGVMTISGFLGEKFAYNKPLTVSASLSFEQTYSEIDGDSASSAEVYVLLSALSGLPLKQGIAVTGSVDQKGNIQPIGGVNEKIEGFYHVCKQEGLDGRQGVIIPEINVKNLMLKEEIIEVVRNKKFHIYPVKSIEEGIEILTGKPAGEKKKDGTYTAGTVFGMADKKLTELAQGWIRFSSQAVLKKAKSGKKK
ncbi:MAG: ATP-binding protein [Candidatus Omnitrophota bacterium]